MDQNLSKLIELSTGYRSNPVFNYWRSGLKGLGLIPALLPTSLALLAVFTLSRMYPGSPFVEPLLEKVGVVVALYAIFRCVVLLDICRALDGGFQEFDRSLFYSEQYWGRMLPLVLETAPALLVVGGWWMIRGLTGMLYPEIDGGFIIRSLLCVGLVFGGLMFASAMSMSSSIGVRRLSVFGGTLALYFIGAMVGWFMLMFIGPEQGLIFIWAPIILYFASGPLLILAFSEQSGPGVRRALVWGAVIIASLSAGDYLSKDESDPRRIPADIPEIAATSGLPLTYGWLCGPFEDGLLVVFRDPGVRQDMLQILNRDFSVRLEIKSDGSEDFPKFLGAPRATMDGNIQVADGKNFHTIGLDGGLLRTREINWIPRAGVGTCETVSSALGRSGNLFSVERLHPSGLHTQDLVRLAVRSGLTGAITRDFPLDTPYWSRPVMIPDQWGDGVYLFDRWTRSLYHFDSQGILLSQRKLPNGMGSGRSTWEQYTSFAVDRSGNLIIFEAVPPNNSGMSNRVNYDIRRGIRIVVHPTEGNRTRSYFFPVRTDELNRYELRSASGAFISGESLFFSTGYGGQNLLWSVNLDQLGLSSESSDWIYGQHAELNTSIP